MYLLVNAMKNLIRNKGRNILIAAVTLAIVIATVVTLTIHNAASRVIDEIRLDIGSRVDIKQDFIEMKQAGLDGRTEASYISMEDFKSFARSDYLSKTIYGADMYAWSGSFFAVDDAGKGTAMRSDGQGGEVLNETCKIVSTSDPAYLSDFGTLRSILPGGRMFEGLNECVISEEMAALNGTSVGDVIEVSGASFVKDKVFHLTVTGIYADETDEYLNMMFAMNGRFADNRRNEIITSFDTLMSVGWESNAGLNTNMAYFLKNPDDIQRFEQEVREKGLPFTYNVSINQDALNKVSGPLSSMRGAVMTFMVVILILGAITLALVSFMAVRERKYEVGVLRAMGMGKGKVALGVFAEAVMIAAICLIIGLGTGSLMAQPVASGILEGRVAAAEAALSDDSGNNKVLFAGGQMQTSDKAAGYEPESDVQVSLNRGVMLQISIITLGLATLSGLVGVVMMTQYEPLKILRERT